MATYLASRRVLALLVLTSLAVLTLLSSSGGPPEVRIQELPKLDSGLIVAVLGVVVDAWSSDSASMSLILADIESSSTVKVVCPLAVESGIAAHIGDEARAVGELELAGGRPVIWSEAGGLTILAPSRDTLSVHVLSEAWPLLLDDRFEIKGIIVDGSSSSFYRLRDQSGTESIALMIEDSLARRVDRLVLMDVTLRLDPTSMSLALEVHSITTTA